MKIIAILQDIGGTAIIIAVIDTVSTARTDSIKEAAAPAVSIKQIKKRTSHISLKTITHHLKLHNLSLTHQNIWLTCHLSLLRKRPCCLPTVLPVKLRSTVTATICSWHSRGTTNIMVLTSYAVLQLNCPPKMGMIEESSLIRIHCRSTHIVTITIIITTTTIIIAAINKKFSRQRRMLLTSSVAVVLTIRPLTIQRQAITNSPCCIPKA